MKIKNRSVWVSLLLASSALSSYAAFANGTCEKPVSPSDCDKCNEDQKGACQEQLSAAKSVSAQSTGEKKDIDCPEVSETNVKPGGAPIGSSDTSVVGGGTHQSGSATVTTPKK